MKKINSLLLSILFSAFILSAQSCKKNKDTEENPECKTCKAYKTADKPEATANVCSDAAEQTFRNQHLGQEITCN